MDRGGECHEAALLTALVMVVVELAERRGELSNALRSRAAAVSADAKKSDRWGRGSPPAPAEPRLPGRQGQGRHADGRHDSPPGSPVGPNGKPLTDLLVAAEKEVSLGHRGHAMIAALIREWESSKEARRYPETFIAWLHSQFVAAQERPDVTWQCMQAYHGRGPDGHMGVPEAMLQRFLTAYQEAAQQEAAAFQQLAQEYAAYVDQAEQELPRQYGHEVIEYAARARRG